MSGSAAKVYLVGAGPGDPGLITVRGRECLERAEVVIYDQLANPELLELAPRAEHIHVGKQADRHTLLQEEINRLLVYEALQGRRVARLKGGDPFVFGRGAEEALALAAAGIPFEVVPGVTAGVAVPAYAGIPVTHRGLSSGFTFLSGHDGLFAENEDESIESVFRTGTLVFFMGVRNLSRIVEQLRIGGRSADTPAAVVEWGSYPKQRSFVATLATIHEVCDREYVQAPAIVIIGDVVSLHDQLGWFESRPLFGRRIVVTRARAQAGELVRLLHELGADVFEFPTIQIEPTKVTEPFDYVGSYDWIILTSVNGVEMLFERLEELGQDARDLHGVRLCVIGAATAEAVHRRFLRVDLMPERYVAEELLASLQALGGAIEGKRFLLPRADIARSFLPAELRKRGGDVRELIAYRTVAPQTSEELADAMLAYAPDLITFTSSSTARNFFDLLGRDRIDCVKTTARFASIGPITASTAEELGMHVDIQPETHDIPHFVDAIVQGFKPLAEVREERKE